MTTVQMIRIVGVVLVGAYLWHLSGLPWGLVGAAGIACLFLPQSVADRFRFLSDEEYQRLTEIRDRHTSNPKQQTAFDVGYLLALIFRLKDRLERGTPK